MTEKICSFCETEKNLIDYGKDSDGVKVYLCESCSLCEYGRPEDDGY